MRKSTLGRTRDGEEVFLAELQAVGDTKQGDARREIALLCLVGAQDRGLWGPGKVHHALHLDGLLVQQHHVGRLVHTDHVLAQPRKVPVTHAFHALPNRAKSTFNKYRPYWKRDCDNSFMF